MIHRDMYGDVWGLGSKKPGSLFGYPTISMFAFLGLSSGSPFLETAWFLPSKCKTPKLLRNILGSRSPNLNSKIPSILRFRVLESLHPKL